VRDVVGALPPGGDSRVSARAKLCPRPLYSLDPSIHISASEAVSDLALAEEFGGIDVVLAHIAEPLLYRRNPPRASREEHDEGDT
jgi:hypothetical protein